MGDKQKIALGQVRPVLGNFKANLDKHVAWIDEAKGNGAALIVFPELGLTGYQVQDLTLDVARHRNHPDIQSLVAQSHGIDIVFSFVEETDDHLFYISSVYASSGIIQSIHRKVYLPTYGMFDEGRYFAAGSSFRAFNTKFGKAGMMICEDAWHVTSPYLLGLDGANLLIVPASSPARSVVQDMFGSQKFWRDLMQVYARLFGLNIIFTNRVGFEDGINFYGSSGVVSADGEWIIEAPALDETLVYGHIDMSVVRRARYTSPILRDEKMHVVLKELERILQKTEESM